MTETATLAQEYLPQFCPVTNFYSCSDGTYLLVTVNQLDAVGTLTQLGILDEIGVAPTQISRAQVRAQPTIVFAANEHAQVIDADDDPSNGMTPLMVLDPGTTFADALAAAGYTLTTTEEP
ncbi:DUF7572 family protein [Gordonia sp. NPDC003376]